MQTSSYYRQLARGSLQNRWGEAAVATLVVLFVTTVLCGMPGIYAGNAGTGRVWLDSSMSGLTTLLAVLVGIPVGLSLEIALLQTARGDENSIIDNVWQTFRRRYAQLVPAGLLEVVVIVLLSLVTFGIAGVIFSYAYRMVPYLIHDYPDLSTRETLQKSRELMRGHKFELFVLDLTFIGWWILCILTAGILTLWISPYRGTAAAHFYEELKALEIEETDEPVTTTPAE